MEILLTGGAGYIGSHTYVELVNAGYQAVIADNFSNSHPGIIPRLAAITKKPVPFCHLDVADRAQMEALFSRHRFEAVIHFASFKAVGDSVKDPIAYYRNNLSTLLTLCEAMEAQQVKRLVFSSSATVYGLSQTMPLTEAMPIGCTNPYGWTKYMGEQILQDVAHAHRDWSVAILRYFNPIGAHLSGLIGEDPLGTPSNLMPYVTQVALGKLPALPIFGHDYPTADQTGVRDYIHVVDLAQGHIAACDFTARQSGCEVFNLGTGRGCSVLDIVKTFERVNGVAVPYVFAERRPGDIASCYADVRKATALLHWRATKTLEDMCRDAWRWQVRNPEGYGGADKAAAQSPLSSYVLGA